MRRRRLLSSATALAVGCLSGCLSLSSGGSRASQTPEPLPTTGDGALTDFDAGEPFERRRVGEAAAEMHHRAVVWNDDADRRSIRVRLRELEGDETPLDLTPTFPAYGSLRIDVFRPADYVLDVSPPSESSRRLGIRRDFVDCNDSATHVAVRPDGSVRARVISTVRSCEADSPTPEGDSPGAAAAGTSETSTAQATNEPGE